MTGGKAGLLRIASVLLATCALASAQTRTISGKVTDENGRPVAGALVEVTSVTDALVGFVARERRRTDGTTWRATTNRNGEFVVGVPTSGIYLVEASKEGVGYQQSDIVVEYVSVTMNLTLAKPSALDAGQWCADDTTKTRRHEDLKAFNESTAAGKAGHPALARLLRWLEAVQLHTAGCNDSPMHEVGRWSRADLETLLGDLANLSAFRRWIKEKPLETSTNARSAVEPLSGGGSRRQSEARFVRDSDRVAAIVLYNRRFNVEDIDRIFHGNDTLRRGALLHTDIATFVRGDSSPYPTVDDGRSQGTRPGTVHWQIGRQLLEDVTPAPGIDAGVLLWYRAVSAYLFAEGDLAEATQHLARARQVFPNHPHFLLDSAYLHLELSSPAVQASVEDVRAGGSDLAVESRRGELQRAERFLRATLSVEPGNIDARIRLGRALGDLGRHADAAAELRKVIDTPPEGELLYLAELFLGREEHALGRKDEAKRRYERASALYPDAQSPQLALAHLARESGDRTAAHRALRTITSPPEADPADPWLWYYKPHRADAEPLMQSMQTQLSGGSP